MITIGKPTSDSKVHARGAKVSAFCKPSLTDVKITEEDQDVTCFKCVLLKNIILKIRDDFSSESAYLDYLHCFTPPRGISKASIRARISRGVEPLAC
jgi:hypothetical protein